MSFEPHASGKSSKRANRVGRGEKDCEVVSEGVLRLLRISGGNDRVSSYACDGTETMSMTGERRRKEELGGLVAAIVCCDVRVDAIIKII